MKIVDTELLLFFRNHKKRGSFVIYLLLLDRLEAKCTRLACKIFRGYFLDIIFGYGNRHRFVLRYKKPSGQYLRLGHIENHSLIVDPNPIQFESEIFFERLEENRLQTLRFIPNVDALVDAGYKWEFGEFELKAGQDFPTFQHLHDIGPSKAIYGMRVSFVILFIQF
jgi:hypothetical protein